MTKKKASASPDISDDRIPKMKLILSTSNTMGGGQNVIRRPTFEKSNAELTSSLRSSFTASQDAAQRSRTNTTTGASKDSLSYRAWTSQKDNILYVPTLEGKSTGLSEERTQYDITVKLFYLPNIPSNRRQAQTKEAIDLVLNALQVSSISLLIISFPGIAFDADDEDSDSDLDSPLDEDSTGSIPEDMSTIVETWRALEELHDSGVIEKLGIAEFGSARLEKFLPQTRIKPSVDQINVRDCCVVPKPLILYAKAEKIELLTHNDCTNILPRGTLRELLGSSDKGVSILAGADEESSDKLKGDVEPQFVVKYTAVVKDRGVVENKGYFAVAELRGADT